MRYTKFEITNYKGVKDTAVIDMEHLPQTKIYTLVGLNESGKTSILEAINLLQNDVDPEKAYKMIHVSDKGNFTGEISIKAVLRLDSDDESRIADFCEQELEFKLTAPIEQVSITRKFLFESSRYTDQENEWNIPLIGRTKKGRKDRDLIEVDEEKWQKVAELLEKNFPKILFYENFLFDFPEKIYLTGDESQPVVKATKQYREIVQDILVSIDEKLSVDEHIVKRFQSGKAEDKSALEACCGDMEARLTDVIIKSWNEVFASSGYEIEVIVDKDAIGVFLQMKIKQGHARYAVSERSLGFRWFFSFLLFTQFRKERRNEFGETLFLLDEPASNLHPRSQQNLLSVFEQLSNDCKIIYSTHSHYLIDPRNMAGTYIVRNMCIDYNHEISAKQSDTDIRIYPYRQFASQYPDQSDHFKPLLDAIDYTPSALVPQDDIIFVEGKNDYYTFKLIEKIISGSNSLPFYPGASVDKLDKPMRLYMAWGKNFVGMFDADKAGIKAKERYEKELGPDVIGRIFTLRDVSDNFDGFTTENLFSDTDRNRISKMFFPESDGYHKSEFNTGIQQLYVDNNGITFDRETTDNFNRLLSFLERQLHS